MASAKVGRIATELHERVIAPLVTGKHVHPLEAIEPDDAAGVAEAASHGNVGGAAPWVDLIRVRHVRMLCPIDVLPPPGHAEWLMAAALNNLLHAANPETNSVFSPRRTRQMLEHAESILDQVRPIDTAGEALRRHATFARLLRLERVDVHVSWWSGSAIYRGRSAPGRLLAWPGLRRVQLRRDSRALASMVEDNDVLRDGFERCLVRLLAATPLTDLAACGRSHPRFAWNGAMLSLLATDSGHTLAVRAIRHGAGTSAFAALRAAFDALDGSSVPWARDAVTSVLKELEAFQALDAAR